jgi:drug/metabolite transporter (DMT)-like permease
MNAARRFTRTDLELLAAVLFWGFNMTVVKLGLREVEPLAYNVARFLGASLILLVLVRHREGTIAVERGDLRRVVLLGIVGHTCYQIFFIEGLARTSASSASLLFASTPLVVAILSRLAGHERIPWTTAIGTLLGFAGVGLIVSGGAGDAASRAAVGEGSAAPGVAADAATAIVGNGLIFAAVLCWSTYTVLARRLLERYSPLRMTAVTLAIGTLFLVPPALPDVLRQDWRSVSGLARAGLVYSLVFALVVSYVIWYRSVKQVGNVRTAIYSNLVPLVGTLFGVLLLGERISAGIGAGAACIVAGIVLTRLAPSRA